MSDNSGAWIRSLALCGILGCLIALTQNLHTLIANSSRIAAALEAQSARKE